MNAIAILLASIGTLCHALPPASNQRDASVLNLTTVSWTVHSTNVSVPAKVPSQAHLDLLAAGVINEPTYGVNDFEQLWVAESNFTYTSAPLAGLSKSSDYSTHLVFDGLDTFADISFCGLPVASVNNQFRKWSFDVSNVLQNCSSNPRIDVAFHAAPPISNAIVQAAYSKSGAFCVPCYGTKFEFSGRQFIRKEQNDYGWDWGPGFAPQGIWQPARVVQVPRVSSKASVESVFVDTYRKGQVNNLPPDQSAPWVLNASVDFLGSLPNDVLMQVDLYDLSGAPFEKIVIASPQLELGRITGSAVLQNQPQLWWPAGHGNQTLYRLIVTLTSKKANGSIATTERRIGFRTIVMNQTPISSKQISKGIAPGSNWHFEINGQEIYAKGSNLIPPDPFWPRVTKSDFEDLFSSAVAANQNMIRAWASGAYLPDFVYDLADEYGLLIWSDLQFSDAFYPNDQDSVENYINETSYQVRRVNHHPSLALWCGGNELELALQLVQIGNIINYPAALDNFESLFLDALLHSVFDNTRSISYIASSISMGYESFDYNRSRPIKERYSNLDPFAIYGSSEYYSYDQTQAFKLSAYPVSRFTGEFGFHSHPSYKVYSTQLPQDQLSFNSSMIIHRNRHYPPSLQSLSTQDPNSSPGNITEMSLEGLGEMSQGATMYFPTPHKHDPATNFSMQIYGTQLYQASFIRSQIDFYRRGSGLRQRNLGTLYWQLNEIWASPSWSSLEAGGRWKLLHHVAGDAYEPVVVAPFVDDFGKLTVSVTSDRWQDLTGNASLTWYDWSGKKLNVSKDWSFASKKLSVGAINSTEIFQASMAFIPKELKTAVAVLNTTMKSQDGTEYSAQRFYTPQYLSNSESIKAFKEPDLKISYNAAADAFTVTSKAVAAFVWLDQPLEASGYFSKNGFWMLPGSETLKFMPFTNSKPLPPGWQKDVTVQSVWDLTTR